MTESHTLKMLDMLQQAVVVQEKIKTLLGNTAPESPDRSETEDNLALTETQIIDIRRIIVLEITGS